MQTFLMILFIVVLITGIASSIIFRKNKGVVVLSILSIFLINGPAFYLLFNVQLEELNKEIERVIQSHDGEILKIKKISFEQVDESPFEKANKYNIIYKIEYTKEDNKTYIAWYRGMKTLNNIHSQNPDGQNDYNERWIFNE